MSHYYVYTDGSSDLASETSGSSYYIQTDTHFINYGFQGLKTKYTLEAETSGLINAVNYLVNSVKPTKDDVIDVYVDTQILKDYIDAYLKGDKNATCAAKNIRSLNKSLSQLVPMVRIVNVYKVRAHTGVVNANMFVDALAKYGRYQIHR